MAAARAAEAELHTAQLETPIETPTAPPQKTKVIQDPRVGESVLFTTGPQSRGTVLLCRVTAIEEAGASKIYHLEDKNGRALQADLSNPDHRLAYPGVLEDGKCGVSYRQLPDTWEPPPDTEPMVSDLHSQPRTPIEPDEGQQELLPWLVRADLQHLSTDKNYLKPDNETVEEMILSPMWDNLLGSKLFQRADPGLQALIMDTLIYHAGGMSQSAPPGSCTRYGKHDVILKEGASVRTRQYGLSPEARKEVDRWIKKMLANGFIKRVNSPHRSPLLVVAKKNSGGEITGWRVCLDCRVLNAATVSFNGSLAATADTIWSDTAGARLFSCFDLKDAFYSIHMTERAKLATAFLSPTTGRQYGFDRMAMGLAGSPGTLARVTASVYGIILGLFAQIYVDDLVNYTKPEHVEATKQAWRTSPQLRKEWSVLDTFTQYKQQLLKRAHKKATATEASKILSSMNAIHQQKASLDSKNSVNLYAGIGGLTGGNTLLYVENDDAAVEVLKARMADGSIKTAEIHRDVRTLKYLPKEAELLVAGFPCQDFSLAGKQAGTTGDKGKLFFEIIRLLRQNQQISWLFLENVAAITSKPEYYKPILKAITDAGFDTEFVTVKASQAGAPHARKRWFAMCQRQRKASPCQLHLPDKSLTPCGRIVAGKFEEAPDVNLEEFEFNPRKRLLPIKGIKCEGKVLQKGTTIKRWATPRSRGGNDANRNLTERGASDLASQLRFSEDTDKVTAKFSQVNADYLEHMMGFPRHWTTTNPLQQRKHLGWFDSKGNSVEPNETPRLVEASKENACRLKLLGNSCVPQQCALARSILNARWESRMAQGIKKSAFDRGVVEQQLRNVSPQQEWKVTPQTDEDFLLLTHVMQLSKLLELTTLAGFRCQSRKTVIFAEEVKLLGHKISVRGLQPCPDKVKAIAKMASPSTTKACRSALGAFSWFRRYIPLYSRRTKHMRALLKKDTPFKWTQECENEFRSIIQILISEPLVVHPDPKKQVYVATDASCDGLGGVVYQLGNEDDPKDIREGIDRPPQSSVRKTDKARLKVFCRDFGAKEGEYDKAMQAMKKLACVMLVEDGVLKLVQRP
eukprot:g3825.t1